METSPFKNLNENSNLDELWKVFKNQYNRNYDDEEDSKRFEIFSDTVKMVIAHNEKFERGEKSFQCGINYFADRTDEERKQCHGYRPRRQSPDE